MSMLTDSLIRGLKPKKNAYQQWDSTGERGVGRLGVKVQPSGQRVFYFRYFVGASAKMVQLGKYPEMSLTAARDAARSLSAQLKAGTDPKTEIVKAKVEQAEEVKRHAVKGTIKQLFDGYTARMEADGKRTWAVVRSDLYKEVFPVLEPETKACHVTPAHIRTILAGMIQRGAPVQSNRVRSYLHSAFQFGLRADFDPAELSQGVTYGLTQNPVSVVPRQAAAEKAGENWLRVDEVRELMATFGAANKVGEQSYALLKLLFYTGGQRPYEILNLTWTDIDLKEKTLTIPAHISKNKKQHLVPLVDSAIEIVQQLKKRNYAKSEYIFVAYRDPLKPYHTDSLAQAIEYYREANPLFRKFIPRDIRRTCKTLMGEIGISKIIRDILMNHAKQDVSSKHYDRYEYVKEKREALALWEKRLNERIGAKD